MDNESLTCLSMFLERCMQSFLCYRSDGTKSFSVGFRGMSFFVGCRAVFTLGSSEDGQ